MVWRQVLFGAWQAANFQRAKKMPSLESVMNRLRVDGQRKPARTPEQWLAQFEQLADALGGDPLKKRPQLKAEYRKERE